MDSWFDILLYAFEWCRDTYYVPIVLGDNIYTFTILQILLTPIIAGISIFVIKHIFDLVN